MITLKTKTITSSGTNDRQPHTETINYPEVIIHDEDDIARELAYVMPSNNIDDTDELKGIIDLAKNLFENLQSDEKTKAEFGRTSVDKTVAEHNDNKETITTTTTHKFTFRKRETALQYTPTNETAKTKSRNLPYEKNLSGEHVADINFDEGIIDITDPCYNKDTWCRKNDLKIIPGEYQINTYTNDSGRVIILQIILKDDSVIKEFNDDKININKSWRTVSTIIGVDAGICGFFQNKPDFDDEEWSELCQNTRYDGQGNLWSGKKPWQKGFYTESGYGDGIYSVHAIRRTVGPNKKYGIVALELRF